MGVGRYREVGLSAQGHTASAASKSQALAVRREAGGDGEKDFSYWSRFFKKLYFYLLAWMCARVHTWRSEDSVQESALSFGPVDPWDRTWVIRFGCEPFTR